MSHTTTVRVYYEDTDAGGVVYHSQYLNYAERARTEMLRERNIIQPELPFYFVVRKAILDLHQPARLDDLLTITTHTASAQGARLVMEQSITRDGATLATLTVTIASVSRELRPVRLPEPIRALLLA